MSSSSSVTTTTNLFANITTIVVLAIGIYVVWTACQYRSHREQSPLNRAVPESHPQWGERAEEKEDEHLYTVDDHHHKRSTPTSKPVVNESFVSPHAHSARPRWHRAHTHPTTHDGGGDSDTIDAAPTHHRPNTADPIAVHGDHSAPPHINGESQLCSSLTHEQIPDQWNTDACENPEYVDEINAYRRSDTTQFVGADISDVYDALTRGPDIASGRDVLMVSDSGVQAS